MAPTARSGVGVRPHPTTRRSRDHGFARADVRCTRGFTGWRRTPERAGEILVRVVKHAWLPGHLLLGSGAAHVAIDYSRGQIAEATAWQDVSASADFGATYPVELPAAP
jgi:hypothetical protein